MTTSLEGSPEGRVAEDLNPGRAWPRPGVGLLPPRRVNSGATSGATLEGTLRASGQHGLEASAQKWVGCDGQKGTDLSSPQPATLGPG